MFVDVFLSALLAAITILMGYLGVHVTLHPTESDRTRLIYKIGFCACAVISVGLVIWQGVRNARSQARQQAELQRLNDQIAHTHIRVEIKGPASRSVDDAELTGKPVTFEFLYSAGKTTMYNINYTNAGASTSKQTGAEGAIIITPRWPNLDAEFSQLAARFPAQWRGEELMPGVQKYFTAESHVLSAEEVEGIKKGTFGVFIIAIVRFSDSTGDYQQEFCNWYEPPALFAPSHGCRVHEAEAKLK